MMSNLRLKKNEESPVKIIWTGIVGVIVLALGSVAMAPAIAKAISQDEPGLSIPLCQSVGISMFWHTKDGSRAAAPEGWKVERRHSISETWVVQTFTFIGAEADALQRVNSRYWDWVDTSAEKHVAYTYRVRAINGDGTDMEGRFWSRRAEAFCTTESSDQPGLFDRPGMSLLWHENSGVAMYWHTKNGGQAEAPDGWKLERRHWGSDGWVVKTFTFIGGEADALQIHNDKYWDFVDITAKRDVSYTYRVRAINADGSDTEGRFWSIRAPVGI